MNIECCNSIKLTYMKLGLCVSIHSHFWRISNVFLNFDEILNLPYLSPYINYVYKNLMYIEGCNSTKLTYMKLGLCVSIHSHFWRISNVFLNFDEILNLPYLSPYINYVYKNLMNIECCNSTKLTYMKLGLCVSFHSHLWSISNVFLKF